MKTIKLSMVILTAFLITIGLIGYAEAYHDGGVARCGGCHSMHQSPDNPLGPSGTPSAPLPVQSAIANGALLKGTDASSTCLNCHKGSGSYKVYSTDGANRKAGGDFFWVKKSFTYPSHSGTGTSAAEEHGHNIVALDYGLIADSLSAAPGGSYLSSKLGCTSCHDAHGQVLGGTKAGQPPISVSGSYAEEPHAGTIRGNYRLLGDSVYRAGNVVSDGYQFTNNAPIARANSYSATYVDYGSGMSEWCRNCHAGYTGGTRHVAGNDEVLNGYADNYNSYVKTGDFTGTIATSYDQLVSFERGTDDWAELDETSTAGPGAGANVMCLTCHRAHASAHENIGRWDLTPAFIAESKALLSADLTATEKANAYYKGGSSVDVVATYGEFQRSLCNKCHAQD